MSDNKPQNLMELLAPVKKYIYGAFAVTSLGVLGQLMVYASITFILQELISSEPSTSTIWTNFLLIVVGLVVYHFAAVGTTGIAHIGEAAFRTRIRKDITQAMDAAPLGWFIGRPAGEVRKILVNDVASLHTIIAHFGSDAANASMTPIVGFMFLLWLDWKLAILIIVLLVGFMYWAFKRFGGFKAGSLLTEYTDNQTDLSTKTVEIVEGIAEIKNYGLAGQQFGRFNTSLARYSDVAHRWLSQSGLVFAIIGGLTTPGGMMTFVFAAALPMIYFQVSEPIVIVPFVLTLIGFVTGLYIVTQLNHLIARGTKSAERIIEVLAISPLLVTDNPQEPKDNSIAMQHVSFGYTSSQQVLTDVSIDIPKNSMCALVGPSGSGKSTLLHLISRFWDVQDGAVVVGGVNVKDIAPQTLLAQSGIVFQNSHVLNDTVRANVALAKPDATQEAIEQAAKQAQIHDRIMELPQGYDTVLGDKGAFLSGGETQRLALSRVFLQDPPIVLLDEATAFADPDSEHAIQGALQELAQGRTVVMIAHRLRSIVQADQIVVLEHGKVIQQGTHDELVKQDGVYQNMWRTQHVVA